MAARASASSQGAVHDEPKKSCGEQCCTLLLPLRLLLVLVKFPFWLIGIVFAFIIALFGLLGFIITLPARCFMKEASDGLLETVHFPKYVHRFFFARRFCGEEEGIDWVCII
eukprot:m.43974 g.43974  ORF g.43974 m.43974 type:complete len:112 (+) comp11670_c0_seq2:211-546(+)